MTIFPAKWRANEQQGGGWTATNSWKQKTFNLKKSDWWFWVVCLAAENLIRTYTGSRSKDRRRVQTLELQITSLSGIQSDSHTLKLKITEKRRKFRSRQYFASDFWYILIYFGSTVVPYKITTSILSLSRDCWQTLPLVHWPQGPSLLPRRSLHLPHDRWSPRSFGDLWHQPKKQVWWFRRGRFLKIMFQTFSVDMLWKQREIWRIHHASGVFSFFTGSPCTMLL